jgi:hypothetical protein
MLNHATAQPPCSRHSDIYNSNHKGMFVIKRLLLIVVSKFNPYGPTQGPALSPPDMALPTVVDLCISQTSQPRGLTSFLPLVLKLHNCGSTGDGSFEIMSGNSLLSQYDGNIIFEIPPEEAATREDYLHYDGLAWTHGNRYSVSNLPGYVKVRKHMCTGHL